MNKHHKVQCELFKGDGQNKCKPCKQTRKLVTSEIKKQIKHHKEKKTYKMSKKLEKRIVGLRKRCERCKKTRKRRCGVKDYMKYSGAEYK